VDAEESIWTLRGSKWQEAGEYCIMTRFITCTLHPPNIIRVIKLRRMRWAGHVARIEEMGTKLCSENLKGRTYT
jgi:hypothetical protein